MELVDRNLVSRKVLGVIERRIKPGQGFLERWISPVYQVVLDIEPEGTKITLQQLIDRIIESLSHPDWEDIFVSFEGLRARLGSCNSFEEVWDLLKNYRDESLT